MHKIAEDLQSMGEFEFINCKSLLEISILSFIDMSYLGINQRTNIIKNKINIYLFWNYHTLIVKSAFFKKS